MLAAEHTSHYQQTTTNNYFPVTVQMAAMTDTPQKTSVRYLEGLKGI
jgi:hypothetical protein